METRNPFNSTTQISLCIYISPCEFFYMNSEISKNEMKELLNFMQRIKNFERLSNIKIWAVERLTWGLLLIAGGILDFVILHFTYDIIGWITTLLWILIIAIALLLSNFQRRNIFITTKKQEISFYQKTQYFWITIAIALVFVFGSTDLNHLTFPVIAGMIGSLLLIDNYLAKRKAPSFAAKINYYLTPISFLLTTIINLVGFFVVGEYFELYQGLVFGCLTGIVFAYGAFLLMQIISRNKIASLDNFTE